MMEGFTLSVQEVERRQRRIALMSVIDLFEYKNEPNVGSVVLRALHEDCQQYDLRSLLSEKIVPGMFEFVNFYQVMNRATISAAAMTRNAVRLRPETQLRLLSLRRLRRFLKQVVKNEITLEEALAAEELAMALDKAAITT